MDGSTGGARSLSATDRSVVGILDSSPAKGARSVPVVEVDPLSPALSGQIATATTAVAPKATTSPAMAAIRLIIRRVAQGADQPRGDHDDDQQRDAVERDRSDVAVGPQSQPGVDDHVDGHGGEEPAEDQAEDQQDVAEVWVQFELVPG